MRISLRDMLLGMAIIGLLLGWIIDSTQLRITNRRLYHVNNATTHFLEGSGYTVKTDWTRREIEFFEPSRPEPVSSYRWSP